MSLHATTVFPKAIVAASTPVSCNMRASAASCYSEVSVPRRTLRAPSGGGPSWPSLTASARGVTGQRQVGTEKQPWGLTEKLDQKASERGPAASDCGRRMLIGHCSHPRLEALTIAPGPSLHRIALTRNCPGLFQERLSDV